MADPLKKVLMERDNISAKEAQDQINEARKELHERLCEGEQPYYICEELFGLEPDYLIDLL